VFVDYLREHHMTSNVDLGEVQAVDLKDLKGLEDVLEALEANVILPLENAELAEELKPQAEARCVCSPARPAPARRRLAAHSPTA